MRLEDLRTWRTAAEVRRECQVPGVPSPSGRVLWTTCNVAATFMPRAPCRSTVARSLTHDTKRQNCFGNLWQMAFGGRGTSSAMPTRRSRLRPASRRTSWHHASLITMPIVARRHNSRGDPHGRLRDVGRSSTPDCRLVRASGSRPSIRPTCRSSKTM